jgi:universal stress protein A
LGIYSHILVAVDLTRHMDHVATSAFHLARELGARLTFIHVVAAVYLEPLYEGLAPLPFDLEAGLVEHARTVLAELARRLDLGDSDRLVAVGSPRTVIAHTARERRADLIVVGRRGTYGLAALLGSTANAILHSAPCDVLAVHVPD